MRLVIARVMPHPGQAMPVIALKGKRREWRPSLVDMYHSRHIYNNEEQEKSGT